MGKKEDPKKENPHPATYITISRVDNGWLIEDLHGRHTILAPTWSDVVSAATAMVGLRVFVRLTLPVDMGD